MTMYQQRWRSKRLLRGYHGDWIPERRFKRWFLPEALPSYHPPTKKILDKMTDQKQIRGILETPTPPVKNLFLRDVERRIDTIVFRCCFAHSVYYARSLVLHGKVSINGNVVRDPGHLLNEGDLVTVDPEGITMLNKHVKKQIEQMQPPVRHAKKAAEAGASAPEEAAEGAEEAVSATEASDEASTEAAAPADQDTEASNATKASEEASESKKASKDSSLEQGVLPFTLPPFAAPFLFIPSYLDVSFRTCSAIYLHHPTITLHEKKTRDPKTNELKSEFQYRSEIPTPYPVSGDMYGLAWEWYARRAPRVRSDARRIKRLGRVGSNGFDSARAFEEDRRRVAVRRGWGRKRPITLPVSPMSRASTHKTQ